MNVLYICKLSSSKGNGVIGAIQNEIIGLKKYCNIGLYNLGVSFQLENFDLIFELNDYPVIENIPSPFNHPDLVIFEEIYKWEYIKLYKYFEKNHIPYIIIPHGSLVLREQRRKYFKKKIANILFFNSYIKNASAVQFLNNQEKSNSKFKIKNSIIIPNSIEFPKDNINCNKKELNNSFIYIGRYSIYTKGLDLLVNTCEKYQNDLKKNKVKFSIYGLIDDNSKKEFEKLKIMIEEKQLNDILFLHGAVYKDAKRDIMNKADFFIQLSRHEGQPMGIIEALSMGLPCLVTYNTSFGEYCEANSCGIATNENIDSIYEAIKKMINLDKKTRTDYSNNARRKAMNDFSIEKVGKKSFDEYMMIIDKKEW